MDSKLVVQKTIGLIRFRPNFESYDDTLKIAKGFEQDYEDWKIDSQQMAVSLYTKTERDILQIKYDQFFSLSEKEAGASDITKKLISCYKQVDINEFLHCGLRTHRILGFNIKFDELVDFISPKIYKEEIASLHDSNVEDILFSIKLNLGEINNNIMVGPVTKEEALSKFQIHFDETKKELEDSKFLSFLSIDVDTYIKNDSDWNKITQIKELNERLVKEYEEYFVN